MIFVEHHVIAAHSDDIEYSPNVVKTLNPFLPLGPLTADIKQPARWERERESQHTMWSCSAMSSACAGTTGLSRLEGSSHEMNSAKIEHSLLLPLSLASASSQWVNNWDISTFYRPYPIHKLGFYHTPP